MPRIKRKNNPVVHITLENRYETRSLIHSGAYSKVYAGIDTKLQRKVAIKQLLLPRVSAKALFRFWSACHAMLECNTPTAAQLYDFFIADAQPYIISQWIDSMPLEETLKNNRLLTMRAAHKISITLAQYLAAIHTKGYMHLNLNPDNIFTDKTGEVMVTDLGVARIVSDTGITVTGMFNEKSLMYLAPEQWMYDTVSSACDVFAYGVILYRMVTGAMPFPAQSIQNYLAAITQGRCVAVQPALLNPHVPAYLDNLIMQCLALRSAERPADGNAVLAALQSQEETIYIATVPAPAPTLILPFIKQSRSKTIHRPH